MRSVVGVAAVVAILCSASWAAAQGDGWGTPPSEGAGAEGGSGWGQPADSGQPAAQPEAGGGGAGWSSTGTPQASDTENPTGGGASGWGQPVGSGGAAPAATPAPAATSAPAASPAPTADEEQGPVGSQFRLAHRVALGAHNHMSGAFLAAWDGLSDDSLHSNTPWLNLSFMYTISRILTLDIFFGFTVGNVSYAEDDSSTIGDHAAGDSISSFELGFGPRLLITLAEGNTARLYTGFGLGVLIGLLNGKRGDADDGVCPDVGGCGGWDAYGFAMAAPIGFEYRFRRVPNLAFSAEVSFHFVYQSIGRRYEDDPDSTDIRSEAEYNHIVVGLGNPRQPGSMNIVDYLSFLTMGFHWLI